MEIKLCYTVGRRRHWGSRITYVLNFPFIFGVGEVQLGALGLHRGRNMCNRMGCEIGFWTRANAAGRGLMTLAVQEVQHCA